MADGRHDLCFTPQDYENPDHTDGDNVCEIVLTTTDLNSGAKTTIDFIVTVVNEPDDDAGDLPALSISSVGQVGEGQAAQVPVTADPAPANTLTVNLISTQNGKPAWPPGTTLCSPAPAAVECRERRPTTTVPTSLTDRSA